MSAQDFYDSCLTENTTFQDGERLVYRLYYNWKFVWIPAGEVVFTVKENEDNYKFEARGKTFSSYESFFKVDDYFAASCDKETMEPRTFLRDVHEGKYFKFDSIYFHPDTLLMTTVNGKSREQAKTAQFSSDHCIQDMLSIIYKIRNVDIDQVKKKDRLDASIFFDNEAFDIGLTLKKKNKQKKIKNLGTYNTHLLEAELVDSYVFEEGSKMKVWFSADQNKVPLQIESPVSIGSVKAILHSHESLKYPLNALD